MEEGRPMVCYLKGAIDSLVHKLKVMKISHPTVVPLLRDLESLRENLVNKFARGRATHNQVKEWMKQIRELVYNIEDWIDPVLATNLGESEIEIEQIDKFKVKIKEARARCKRYDLLRKAPISNDADLLDYAPSKVAIDSRLLWEKAFLVGVDGPRKEIEEYLQEKQKKRRVVSVLGIGGHGKTALAKEVYEKLNRHFECHASVTVGRDASTTALMDLFLQVNPGMDDQEGRSSMDEQKVVFQLWEFLQNKRYFIFIDDIQNTHTWSIINCALPNNDLGSRVLTTTRIKDVAMSCSVRRTDVVYEMKGLDKGEARHLLLTTIAAQTEHRSANIGNKCDAMLKMCSGLPLAIILTAGLLARRPTHLGPLGNLEESSLSKLDQSSMSDGMRSVLDICFADLYPPVKACFLYLSAFPENYRIIKKDRLIWKWVAEGFIPKTGQESLWETGESYFNELICRKLIRPVFDDYNDDQPVACTIHRVIRDFIVSQSRQENFLTAATELISGPFPCGTIRRFSVDCSRQENDEDDTFLLSAVYLSRVRSLSIFGNAGRLPHLSVFKHLRVLDLEDTKTLDDEQLERVGLLSLLSYLGLGGTNVTKMPKQIIELEHLSTLDLRRTNVMELPEVGDTELVSVLADGLIMPRGIGEMNKLEELSKVSLQPDNAAGLVNKSRRLRMLGVTFGYVYIPTKTNQQGVKLFLEEVGKSNLHSFCLDDYPCDSVGLLVECWADKRPHCLRKFELRISDYLRVVPQNMASLIALTHLHIRVRELEAQGVCSLGNLPNLVLLTLFSRTGTQGRLNISSKHGFRCLKVFSFSCSVFLGMGLQFKEGAMPHLQRLQIDISARETKYAYGDFDFGMQHLYYLIQLHAVILCKHATVSEAEDAEAAIRNQVSQMKEADNSSTPSVDIRISILPESSSHLPIQGPISSVMEDAMVSASTGALNSVLTKLTTLMGVRYAELTGMNEQQMILRDELRVMDALLKQLSGTPDLNIHMKECRNQMRELTYDIEDSIDDLMVRSVNKKGTGAPSKKNKKGTGSTEKRVMPHDFLDQIQKLNAQVEKADLRSMVRNTEMRTLVPSHMASREQGMCNEYDERYQPSIESTRKILDISYADLPPDMKTCLLYLSRFPAKQVIRKDRLIRRWVTEGFLPKRSLETWWETGESYILELIARKLIEPVYDEGEDVLPAGCAVGDSVHDFITSLSSEENFVTSGQHCVFWRLSDSRPSYKAQNKLKAMFKVQKVSNKVRSLTFDGEVGFRGMPDLSAFKHVRVLDLEDIKGLHKENLRSVGRLSLLRYLGLAGTGIWSLPHQIIALEHLETVDLGRTMLEEFPAFKSTKLVSLVADHITLPTRMGEMHVLEELSTVLVDDDGDRLAKVVNQSKRLEKLGVKIDYSACGESGLKDLLVAIGNSNIQSLCLHMSGPVLLDLLLDCWAQQRPRHLKKLQLTMTYDTLPEVPRDMLPSLIDLTQLCIEVERVDTEGLCILGKLPNLVFLNLKTWDMTGRSIISKNGFRCIRMFWYECLFAGTGLQFEAGAMPLLRRLRLEFSVKKTESEFGGVDFGIQFLACLVEVHAIINCKGSTAASVEAAEAAMRFQVSQNPNNPVLKLTRERVDRMVRDDGQTFSLPHLLQILFSVHTLQHVRSSQTFQNALESPRNGSTEF